MDFSLFKKHPVILIGVAVVGAYIFYELALAGGGNSTQAVSDGANYGAVANGTQVGLQAQVQAHQDDLNAALAGQAADNATKIQLAIIAAQSGGSQQGAAISGTIDLANIQGGVQKYITDANNATQVKLTQDNNATSIANAKILSDTQTGLATIANTTGLSYAKIASDTNLGLAGIQANTTTTLAGIQGAVTNNQIDAQKQISIEAIKSRASASNTSSILGVVGSVIGAFL